MTDKTNPDPLLNRKEAARYLDLKPNTLAVWDCTKRHNLNPLKIGGVVKYRRSDLEKFLSACNAIKRPKK